MCINEIILMNRKWNINDINNEEMIILMILLLMILMCV